MQKVAQSSEEEELEAAGLNRSDVHVGFMTGSSQMDIDGIEDSTRVPVFRTTELGSWEQNEINVTRKGCSWILPRTDDRKYEYRR